MSNPLDDLPKVDPRTPLVSKAEAEIGITITKLAAEHRVTYAELIGILARQIDKWAWRQIRHERGERRDTDEDNDQ